MRRFLVVVFCLAMMIVTVSTATAGTSTTGKRWSYTILTFPDYMTTGRQHEVNVVVKKILAATKWPMRVRLRCRGELMSNFDGAAKSPRFGPHAL